MSAEKNTTEKIEVQAVQTEQMKDAADKKQEMLCALLEKGKNSHNQLTYADIADILDSADLDKNQMDDMYELLMAKGIEIVSETEPEDFDVRIHHSKEHSSGRSRQNVSQRDRKGAASLSR